MDNSVTEAPSQDKVVKVDRERQDTSLTVHQEEPMSEDTAKHDTADAEEGKADSPTEKDKDYVESPNDSSPLGEGKRADDQQKEQGEGKGDSPTEKDKDFVESPITPLGEGKRADEQQKEQAVDEQQKKQIVVKHVDEGDRKIQDTSLTANQEKLFSEGNAGKDQNKKSAANAEEGKGDSPTEKDKDFVESPNDSTPLGAGKRADDQQKEQAVDEQQNKQTVKHDADSKKIEVDLTDGAPESLNKESGDKMAVTSKLTTEQVMEGDRGKKYTSLIANQEEPISEGKARGQKSDTDKKSTAHAEDDEGNSESATENQDPVPERAPTPEPTVPVKGIEITGPTPLDESRPISDVPQSIEGGNYQAKKTIRFCVGLVVDLLSRTKDNKRRIAIVLVPLVALVLVPLVAFLLHHWLQPKEQTQQRELCPIDRFHQEMGKLKFQFPSQREELWKRSRIHLQRHFQIAQPTEPISVILTAGVRAEGTLHCLAENIASALSSALNASVLHLDGAGKSSQDSDLVKSDIDSQLQEAFEGGKPIAVIHRFEELPPASTLIFYRYCDHENAAFKKTFLIFTVLLGEEEEIQTNIRLSEVEEMVTDHLQKKFLSHGHPTAFDKMDIDKYGGLWSRISHLILPVSTEERIETTQKC